MQIDWFTFIAELINFLVLMLLLKRFLYGPIIKAMDRRERKITASLLEATEKTQEAQREADLYRQQQQELKDQREAMSTQAKAEVEVFRLDLIKSAHAEVDATQAKWYTAIKQEKDSFMQSLHQQIGQQIGTTLRRALADLANADLEHCIIEVFIDRIQKLDADQREVLCRSLTHSGEVVVYSAFDIPETARQRIDKVVGQIANDIDLRFETASEPICGIELKADSYKLSWSLESYLATLEESLSTVLDEEVGEKGGLGAPSGDKGQRGAGGQGRKSLI